MDARRPEREREGSAMTIARRMARMLTQTGPQFTAPTLGRYLSDPAFRAEVDAERVQRQAEFAAPFEAHDRARQEAAWARDIEPDLGEPMLNNIPGGMA